MLEEFARHAPADDVPLAPPADTKNIAAPRSGFRYAGQYEGASADAVKAPSKSVWPELDKIDAGRLARYLENEHPQTAAVVLARLDRSQAANVLSKFDESFTADIVDRMLSADGVKEEILSSVEQTLRREFVDQGPENGAGQDSLKMVVELLGKLDPATEHKFLERLSHRNQDAAKRIRGQRFAFEDLEFLDADELSRVATKLNPSKLALALKGASNPLRERVLGAFTTRVARSLEAEMAGSGPVRLRDVDAAQIEIADAARLILARHRQPEGLVA